MMDKKGQFDLFWFMVLVFCMLIIVVIICLSLSSNYPYQHGTSRDIVQGYDAGPIWNHAYLKNDHNTAYCFDEERFLPILEKAEMEQKEVIITYEKYFLRGALCSTSDNYENVIIVNVELVK